jgi:hypothetical protein
MYKCKSEALLSWWKKRAAGLVWCIHTRQYLGLKSCEMWRCVIGRADPDKFKTLQSFWTLGTTRTKNFNLQHCCCNIKSQTVIFTLSETISSEREAHTSAPTSTPAAQCTTLRKKKVQSAGGSVLSWTNTTIPIGSMVTSIYYQDTYNSHFSDNKCLSPESKYGCWSHKCKDIKMPNPQHYELNHNWPQVIYRSEETFQFLVCQNIRLYITIKVTDVTRI